MTARGILAGLVGALAMTLMLLVLRQTLGLATPLEMVGDRLTAVISIAQFFALLLWPTLATTAASHPARRA